MSEKANLLQKKAGQARETSSFSKPKPVSNRSKSKDSPTGNILHLQRTLGNREVRRLVKSGKLQAKLKIGKPNDKYEQEADRVADKVMKMPEPKQSLVNGHSSSVQRQAVEEEEPIQTKPLADQITPLVQRQAGPEEEEKVQTKLQRQAEEEEEPVQTKLIQRQEIGEEEEAQTKLQRKEEDEDIQAKQAPNHAPAVTSNIESGIQSLKGGGQPLSESTRNYFEPRFGADFSRVRLHTDSKAAETAKSISAKAFTTGKDMVFGAGQYSPGTSSGKRLLAHELTHVVQQGKNKVISNPGRTIQRFFGFTRKRRIEKAMERDRRDNYGPNAKYTVGDLINKYSKLLGVPSNYVKGIIYYETKERGIVEGLGELYYIQRKNPKVSLGLGDVQVERAAEILFPGRDFKKRPLIDGEFNSIVKMLKDHETHIKILVLTLKENYKYYGKMPGKTIDDRWKFAIAKHKGGHGVVGPGQDKAMKKGEDGNKWADVSKYMDSGVVEFVNNVVNYKP